MEDTFNAKGKKKITTVSKPQKYGEVEALRIQWQQRQRLPSILSVSTAELITVGRGLRPLSKSWLSVLDLLVGKLRARLKSGKKALSSEDQSQLKLHAIRWQRYRWHVKGIVRK